MTTKIYTKGGDLGETSLLGGRRVSKSNLQLEAYGTVDELNSTIGVCLAQILLFEGANKSAKTLQSVVTTLKLTQHELFNIGSHLACEDEKLKPRLPELSKKLIAELESEIDKMTAELPVLKDFVMPGGHITSATLHVARTVCRRAERITISFIESQKTSPQLEQKHIVITLNRLSDYLFVAARYTNAIFGEEEIKWLK
ncbi:MAG: cob(I)yrinic acid a,c-diamide adenosyltransferase [Bdellovibrionales bacterium]|nr:cob(I)yrinic acid a,c-diamide adenosyltransferase [Bdellovibrionales bacterium]